MFEEQVQQVRNEVAMATNNELKMADAAEHIVPDSVTKTHETDEIPAAACRCQPTPMIKLRNWVRRRFPRRFTRNSRSQPCPDVIPINVVDTVGACTRSDERKENFSCSQSSVREDAQLYPSLVDAREAASGTEIVDCSLPHSRRQTVNLERRSIPLSQILESKDIKSDEEVCTDVLVHNDLLKVVIVAPPEVDKSWISRALRSRIHTASEPRIGEVFTVYKDSLTFSGSDGLINCRIWHVEAAARPPQKENAGQRGYPDDSEEKASLGAHQATQSLFFSDQALYILVWDLGFTNDKTCRKEPTEESQSVNSYYSSDCSEQEDTLQAETWLQDDFSDRVLSWVQHIQRSGTHSVVLPVAWVPKGLSESEFERRYKMMQSMLNDLSPHQTENVNFWFHGETVLCVKQSDGSGIEELRRTIRGIAMDRSTFEHVGAPVALQTVKLAKAFREWKSHPSRVKLVPLDQLLEDDRFALSRDDIIPALNFLASVGEILFFQTNIENDMLSKYIVLDWRLLRLPLECILRLYLGREESGNPVAKTLIGGGTCSCPVTSMEDVQKHSKLDESSISATETWSFLQRLFTSRGICLSVPNTSPHGSDVLFVPGLVARWEPDDVWTFKNAHSYNVTLCHSWLIPTSFSTCLMNEVVPSLVSCLYEFASKPGRHCVIRHLHCWKTSVRVQIASAFTDSETGKRRESIADVYIALVDRFSKNGVAVDVMKPGMQRIVVCGKGQDPNNGRKLWRGGYKAVVWAIQKALSSYNDVHVQLICPRCLATGDPRFASAWNEEEVVTASRSTILCKFCHTVDVHLISGCSLNSEQRPHAMQVSLPVSDMFLSVVLVSLWDSIENNFRSVGSGFIADRKRGLIVTAGHVLFDLQSGTGPEDHMKIVVGVIPKKGQDAVFKYFANLVVDDMDNHVDACVLQIRATFDAAVYKGAFAFTEKGEAGLTPDSIRDEMLPPLKISSVCDPGESIQLLGFNQDGEGLLAQGSHINRSPGLANGTICTKFCAHRTATEWNSSTPRAFLPQEEIVIDCRNKHGNSGGPCVNIRGHVVGILSRGDPENRGYLVPGKELKALVKRARRLCRPSRPMFNTTISDLRIDSEGAIIHDNVPPNQAESSLRG